MSPPSSRDPDGWLKVRSNYHTPALSATNLLDTQDDRREAQMQTKRVSALLDGNLSTQQKYFLVLSSFMVMQEFDMAAHPYLYFCI